MSLSNYGENHMLTALFTDNTIYVGYGDGATEASFSEFSGNGYTRKAFGAFTVTSVGQDTQYVENDADIVFDMATGPQGLATHFGFFDAVSAGNFIGSVTLAELGEDSINVILGTMIEITAGTCRMFLD